MENFTRPRRSEEDEIDNLADQAEPSSPIITTMIFFLFLEARCLNLFLGSQNSFWMNDNKF